MKQKLKKAVAILLAAVMTTAVFLCLNVPLSASAAQGAVKITAAQRQAIADYAVDMTENPSLKRSWFEPYGGDCMSFTANCLMAAGLTWDTESSKKWYYYDMNNRAPAWSSSTSMEEYCGTHQKGSTGLITKRMYKGSPGGLNAAIVPGDLIFFSYAGNGTFNHSAVITTGGSKSSSIRFASHTAGGIKSFSTWTTAKQIAIYRIEGYFPNTVPKGAFDLRPDKYDKGSNYLQISQTAKMYMGSSQGNVSKNYVITVQGYMDYTTGTKPFGYCTSMNRVFNGNNSYNKSGTIYDKVRRALTYGLSHKGETYKDFNAKTGFTLKSTEEAFYVTQMGIWYGMGQLSISGTTIKYGSYTVQANPKNSNGARILSATKAFLNLLDNAKFPTPPQKTPTLKITAPSPNKAVYNNTSGAYIAGPYAVSVSAGKYTSYAVSFTQNTVKATIVDSGYKAKTTFNNGDKFYIKIPTASAAATVKVQAVATVLISPKLTIYTPKINGDKVQGVITGEPNPADNKAKGTASLATEVASITLTKKDADTGAAVTTGGAGFQLKSGSSVVKFTGSASGGYTFSPSGTVTTIYTNASTGTVSIQGLPLGSYTITETVAPKNYNLPSNPTQTVTLKNGANTVTFSDPYKIGSLTISKTDEETKELVKDKTGFTLKQGSVTIKFTGSQTAGYKYSKTGSVTTIYTNPETGKAAITGLKIGSYTITEVDPPDGYDLPAAPSQTISLAEGNNTVTFADPKTIAERLTLVKRDEDTGELVLGKTGFTITHLKEPDPEPESSEEPGSSDSSDDGDQSSSVGNSSDLPVSSEAIVLQARAADTSSDGTTSTPESSDGTSSESKTPPEPVPIKMTFTGDPVKGYRYDPDGEIGTVYTNAETGKVLILGLEEGNYTITETEAPPYYNLPAKPSQTVRLIIGNNTVTFRDPRKTAPLTLHKTDLETGDPVLGEAGFTFTQDDELIHFSRSEDGSYTVDKDGEHKTALTDPETGKVIIRGLRVNDDYLIEEVQAPRGYNLPSDPKQLVTIKEKDNAVIFADPAKYGELVIEKVTEDEAPVEGITFRVQGDNFDETFTIEEGETSITIKNLKAGEYTITEENCPIQYATPDPAVIFLEGDGPQTITVENKIKRGRVKIIKKDSENDELLLPGTTFTLMGEGEELIEQLVTDEKGEALSQELLYGIYTVTEIAAPDGFVLSPDNEQEVLISEDQQVLEVTFENEMIKSAIKIIKVDKEDGDVKLPNAEFGIYGDEECNNLIETLVTDENGEVISSNLPFGTYYVREIKPPDGYEKNEEIYSIVISEDDTVMEVKVPNQKIFGSIEVDKRDADQPEKLLEGAVFGLYSPDGKLIEEKTTDKNGRAVFKNLLYGKYTIKELKPPQGYSLSEHPAVEVEILKQDQVVHLEFKNRKTTNAKTGDDLTMLWISVVTAILFALALMILQRRRLRAFLRQCFPKLYEKLNGRKRRI